MERPTVQKLLDDVRARKIDVIVVYKVDRLQSLALQEKTGFPFERERVCVCVAVRESCGVACEPFAPTIAPVRGSRQ